MLDLEQTKVGCAQYFTGLRKQLVNKYLCSGEFAKQLLIYNAKLYKQRI